MVSLVQATLSHLTRFWKNSIHNDPSDMSPHTVSFTAKCRAASRAFSKSSINPCLQRRIQLVVTINVDAVEEGNPGIGRVFHNEYNEVKVAQNCVAASPYSCRVVSGAELGLEVASGQFAILSPFWTKC